MKKLNIIILSILLSLNIVYSSVVEHSADEILSDGSMSFSNYSFPDSVFVSDNIGIGTENPGQNKLFVKVSTGGTDPLSSVASFVLGNLSTYPNGIFRVKNAGNRGEKGQLV